MTRFAAQVLSKANLTCIQYPSKQEATVRWLQKDDTTFYMDEMARIQKWQYYISSYMRVEHTESVVRSRLQKVVLERNLPSDVKDMFDEGLAQKRIHINEGLVVRICLNSYKMVFEKGTYDSFVFDRSLENAEDAGALDKQSFRDDLQSEKFRDKWVTNNAWMKDTSHEEVQKTKDDYQRWREAMLASDQDQPAPAESGDIAMAD